MARKEIFRARVGSQLYGLSTPESDEDFMSVFIPSGKDILGLHPVKEINSSTKSSTEDRRNTKDDTDDIAKALPEFLKLLLANNPNIVELLFVPQEHVITSTIEYGVLIANFTEIISTRVLHTFTGYAFSQKKKLMVKKERYGSLSSGVDFMETSFKSEILDPKSKLSEAKAEYLNEKLKYYKGSKGNCEPFHKGMPIKVIYEQVKAEHDNYGWRVKTESFAKLGYDVKFAYHLIRILSEGTQLLSKGFLEFPIDGDAKSDIMAIRNQEVSYEELLDMFDRYNEECIRAAETTKLRSKPNFKWADEYLIKTLTKHIINENK